MYAGIILIWICFCFNFQHIFFQMSWSKFCPLQGIKIFKTKCFFGRIIKDGSGWYLLEAHQCWLCLPKGNVACMTDQTPSHTSQTARHTNHTARDTSQTPSHTSQTPSHTSQIPSHTSQTPSYTSQTPSHTSQTHKQTKLRIIKKTELIQI